MKTYIILLSTFFLCSCSSNDNEGNLENLQAKVKFHCKMNLDNFESLLKETKVCRSDKEFLNDVKEFYKNRGQREMKYEFYFCTSCRDIRGDTLDSYDDKYHKLLFDQKTNDILLKDSLSAQDAQIVYENTLKIVNLVKYINNLPIKK